MTEHPSEYSLELHVLSSGSLDDAEHRAILAHVDRCNGCRSLVQRMSEFYRDLHAEFGAAETNPPRLTPDDPPLESRRPPGST